MNDDEREAWLASHDGRWQVACINWTHPAAPHVMTYLAVDGEAEVTSYHETLAEAIAYLDRWAQVLATAAMTLHDYVDRIRTTRRELDCS